MSNKKIPYHVRRSKIQAVADSIAYEITYINDNLKIELIYNNKKITSRYICLIDNYNNQYIIRVSDHDNNRKETYNYNVIIDKYIDKKDIDIFKIANNIIDKIKEENILKI